MGKKLKAHRTRKFVRRLIYEILCVCRVACVVLMAAWPVASAAQIIPAVSGNSRSPVASAKGVRLLVAVRLVTRRRFTLVFDAPILDAKTYRHGGRIFLEVPDARATALARLPHQFDARFEQRGSPLILSFPVTAAPQVKGFQQSLEVLCDDAPSPAALPPANTPPKVAAAALPEVAALAPLKKQTTQLPRRDGVPTNQRRESEREGGRRHRLLFAARLGNIFSSNINRDEDGEEVASYGFAPGFDVRYQLRSEKSRLGFEYNLRAYSFTNTQRWDRVSHKAEASYERQLSRRWNIESIGAFALSGVTEDRRIADQYLALQGVEYRLASRRYLRGFGAFRVLRYPRDEGRNATNPYVGGSFLQRLPRNRRWEADLRYDRQNAESSRNRFTRWSFDFEFRTPLLRRRQRRDGLTLEAVYRSQTYARRITVDGVHVPQHDNRWEFGALYERPLTRHFGIEFGYNFEQRLSNDSDRNFNEHRVGFAATYRWRKEMR